MLNRRIEMKQLFTAVLLITVCSQAYSFEEFNRSQWWYDKSTSEDATRSDTISLARIASIKNVKHGRFKNKDKITFEVLESYSRFEGGSYSNDTVRFRTIKLKRKISVYLHPCRVTVDCAQYVKNGIDWLLTSKEKYIGHYGVFDSNIKPKELPGLSNRPP